MELGRVMNYNVSIEPSDNKGFIVFVGCGRFAYETKESLLADLDKYLSDPDMWEDKYNSEGPRPSISAGFTEYPDAPRSGRAPLVARERDDRRSRYEDEELPQGESVRV